MCVLILFGSLLLGSSLCQEPEYKIPEATLEELIPKGLKISLPDWDRNVTLVAFHVSVNKEFDGVEHGQWAADFYNPRKGRWSYTIPDVALTLGDTVYYWVYCIRHGLGYQNLNRSYRVG